MDMIWWLLVFKYSLFIMSKGNLLASAMEKMVSSSSRYAVEFKGTLCNRLKKDLKAANLCVIGEDDSKCITWFVVVGLRCMLNCNWLHDLVILMSRNGKAFSCSTSNVNWMFGCKVLINVWSSMSCSGVPLKIPKMSSTNLFQTMTCVKSGEFQMVSSRASIKISARKGDSGLPIASPEFCL